MFETEINWNDNVGTLFIADYLMSVPQIFLSLCGAFLTGCFFIQTGKHLGLNSSNQYFQEHKKFISIIKIMQLTTVIWKLFYFVQIMKYLLEKPQYQILFLFLCITLFLVLFLLHGLNVKLLFQLALTVFEFPFCKKVTKRQKEKKKKKKNYC